VSNDRSLIYIVYNLFSFFDFQSFFAKKKNHKNKGKRRRRYKQLPHDAAYCPYLSNIFFFVLLFFADHQLGSVAIMATMGSFFLLQVFIQFKKHKSVSSFCNPLRLTFFFAAAYCHSSFFIIFFQRLKIVSNFSSFFQLKARKIKKSGNFFFKV
jgi:hypothetical protein